MKLYKAVDKVDDNISAFLVYNNGDVSVSSWMFSEAGEILAAKKHANQYLREPAERFKDAIDPVLIAEW